MPRQACEGAIAKCRASYPAGDFGRERVWLALVLDARQGLMYQHYSSSRDTCNCGNQSILNSAYLRERSVSDSISS
jgi:hypothetical protein